MLLASLRAGDGLPKVPKQSLGLGCVRVGRSANPPILCIHVGYHFLGLNEVFEGGSFLEVYPPQLLSKPQDTYVVGSDRTYSRAYCLMQK